MEYGDNISRQQAIDLTIGLSNDSVDFVRAGIKALPPAQPQRTGKWLMNDHIGTFKIFTCDKCGWNSEAPFNFCPNCGDKKEHLNKTCDCYSDGRCVGTKEIEPCSCGGNKSKCDFYENVRREGDAE